MPTVFFSPPALPLAEVTNVSLPPCEQISGFTFSLPDPGPKAPSRDLPTMHRVKITPNSLGFEDSDRSSYNSEDSEASQSSDDSKNSVQSSEDADRSSHSSEDVLESKANRHQFSSYDDL